MRVGLVDPRGGPGQGKFSGSEIAVGEVGTVLVVVDAPVADEDVSFEEAVELPRVEQLVAEPAVERLDPGVLPRRSRVDGHARGAVAPAPLGEDDRDEVGAVVEAHERRGSAPLDREAIQDGDDVIGGDRVLDADLQALARALVDDVEHIDLPVIDGVIELEVERPQRVGAISDMARCAARPSGGAARRRSLMDASVGARSGGRSSWRPQLQ